ncbi:hypothetical protein KAR10_00735, partial [bacterium]|nr:hypothetical protein [bacterium]
MVKYVGLALAVIFIPALVVSSVAAKKATPLEKALRALCEKKEPAGRVDANGNTEAAGAIASQPVLPASGGGNTIAATAKKKNPLVSGGGEKGNTLAAQTNIHPAGGQPDPMRLTAVATAQEIKLSWSNTATAWSGFAGYLVFKTEHGGKADRLNTFPLAGNSYRDLTVT